MSTIFFVNINNWMVLIGTDSARLNFINLAGKKKVVCKNMREDDIILHDN